MFHTMRRSCDSVHRKPQIVVSVVETDSTESECALSVSSGQTSGDQKCTYHRCHSITRWKRTILPALDDSSTTIEPSIRVSIFQQARERARLAYTSTACACSDLKSFYSPVSDLHRFSHRVVDPLFTWRGKNTRIICGRSLGTAHIEDRQAGSKLVIHAGSHNYAGFYRMTNESERLHKLALDCLPIASYQAPPALSNALHASLAEVFGADFCYTTSTGYASNLLALSAILRPGWLCMMDAKSHNSMHVGAYISDADRILKYRHNDMSHLEELLDEHSSQYAHVLVAVEGLFSMDGTIPPLATLARLKRRYGFVLLVNEAHSLLSIGHTGKGCVELWNDTLPETPIPKEVVDIRTAVLSKTLGAIGGMVCGKREFHSLIGTRCKQMQSEGLDPVLTATMVQCLHVLGQPSLLEERLARMRQMSEWARSELKRFGIHVYGDDVTPLLPIHTGRASTAAKLSYTLRKCGILATPVSTPAVPFWQSRIRVCLSADHSDAQLNTLIRTIIECAQNIGIISRRTLEPHVFATSSSLTQVTSDSNEASQACQAVENLIQQDLCMHATETDPAIQQAGHEARQRFGLAAGGARWISGTFSVHVQVERLIIEHLQLDAALSYSDSYVGLLSTASALCRPLLRSKLHTFLLPTDCPLALLDGIKASPKSTRPTIAYYDSSDDLTDLLACFVASQQQVTIYLSTSHQNRLGTSTGTDQNCFPGAISIQNWAHNLEHLQIPSRRVTILLHDKEPSICSAGKMKALNKTINDLHQITKNLLVYGDFMSSFGVPGAYLAGSQQLIEELRYSSRGYMFSTAPLPFIMGIVKHGLEKHHMHS